MQKKLSLMALAFFLFAPLSADAKCRWTFDCSNGPCKQVPICDSTLDIVPPKPPRVAPIAPPSIKPIDRPRVPPVGTTSCTNRYLCNDYGHCSWQNVCR